MKNDYEIRGDITAIIINSSKYGVKEALISTSKLERMKEFSGSWFVFYRKSTNAFYAQGKMPKINGKQKTAYLHRWITNALKGTDVDHKNHDGLRNTDDNLRVCTRAENGQNRTGAQINSESGIRGVCWEKRKEKWRAYIHLKGKKIHLGYFDTIADAERAVKEARKKYMPYSKEASSM